MIKEPKWRRIGSQRRYRPWMMARRGYIGGGRGEVGRRNKQLEGRGCRGSLCLGGGGIIAMSLLVREGGYVARARGGSVRPMCTAGESGFRSIGTHHNVTQDCRFFYMHIDESIWVCKRSMESDVPGDLIMGMITQTYRRRDRTVVIAAVISTCRCCGGWLLMLMIGSR